MKKERISVITIFLLMSGLTVSGCAALYDENHGSKVTSNKILQTIDLGASEKEGPVATLEGQKAEQLMTRYRKEKAEAPTEKLLKDLGD